MAQRNHGLLERMREHHLLVQPNRQLQATRTSTGRKSRPTKPNEWWGIEMTKVFGEGFGGVSSVVALAWSTKMMVGSYAGTQCQAQHWLAALDLAVNRQFPAGARGQGQSLMSDNGYQPTSTAFLKACGTLGIQQAITSDNNPKGNADTERVMRTLKEACLWLQEWTCPFALMTALERGIAAYNAHHVHSTLGDKPPRQFERAYDMSHGTQFPAA